MSGRIWTPEELTPQGWDPDEWVDVNSWNPNSEPMVVVDCKIIRATYHKTRETIALQVRTPDGTDRVTYMHKANFTFGGRKHSDLPAVETDREMEKTADLLNRRSGHKLKLKMYKSQWSNDQ